MPLAPDEHVIVGRVTAVFGIKGWVKVASFTEHPDDLLDYRPWRLDDGRGGWVETDVVEVARRSKGFIARLEDCRDRDAAARYAGRDIAVERSQLPPTDENEYYWSDLTGCSVVTTDGTPLGTVERLMATGANDVLVVQGEDRERLLPFTEQVIVEVDLTARMLRADWDPEF